MFYSAFVSLTHSIPNAENATRDELEVAARCAPTQKAHNRLRAMIALIEGFGIRPVAKLFGVSVRTVQRWGGSFNKRGIDGLLDQPRPGRPTKIDTETVEQCRDLIEHSDKAGQTQWTIERLDKTLIRVIQRHTKNPKTCPAATNNQRNAI